MSNEERAEALFNRDVRMHTGDMPGNKWLRISPGLTRGRSSNRTKLRFQLYSLIVMSDVVRRRPCTWVCLFPCPRRDVWAMRQNEDFRTIKRSN